MQAQAPGQAFVTAPQGVQPQMVTVQPAQTTYRAATNQPWSGYWKGMTATGIVQIVLGSLTLTLGIVALVKMTFLSPIGYPLWCGLLFYIVAGILGVVAGQKKSSHVAVSYMVVSIFACLASCVVIGLSATSIAYYKQYCSYYPAYYPYCGSGTVAVGAVLIVLGMAELVVAIIGAGMTCVPLSSRAGGTPTANIYQAQPQMVVTGLPEYVYAPQPAVGAPQGQPQPPIYQPQAHGQATPPANDFKA